MIDLTLPQGCEIHHFSGRNQPFTVYIPGRAKYHATAERFVWRFTRTLEEARAVVSAATGWEPSR